MGSRQTSILKFLKVKVKSLEVNRQKQRQDCCISIEPKFKLRQSTLVKFLDVPINLKDQDLREHIWKKMYKLRR